MSAAYDPYVHNTQTKNYEKAALVEKQADEVAKIMKDNIDKLYLRGERMEVIKEKTDELKSNAGRFSRTSQIVYKRMWWKDLKWKIIISVTILIILGAIIGSVVGTMTQKNP